MKDHEQKNNRLNLRSIAFKTVFFTAGLLLISEINAQQTSFSPKTSQERDALFYQTLSIFPTEKIPAQYLVDVQDVRPIKCATMQYMLAVHEMDRFTPEQQSLLKSLFSRPELPESHRSANGWFRVHYTLSGFDAVSSADLDGNGVPDYVEAVAQSFEESYTFEIQNMNFRIPPNDAGIDGDEYDVYVQGLNDGVYGTTTPELAGGVAGERNVPSYIRIDNDFENGQYTSGLPGVQVTAAHEYLHAIQFGYRDAYYSNEYFFYELCASWIEDVVYDDVNDYFASTPWYLGETDRPFNQFRRATLFNYGAAIWYHFLDEKYGGNDLVLRAWEIMGSGQRVLDAVQTSFSAISTDFETEFAEFAVWNYFTGTRSDVINFYEEGAAFGEIDFEDEFIFRNDTTLIDSALTLSYKYYKFTTTEPGSYVFSGTATRNSDWRLAAIARQQGLPAKIRIGGFDEDLRLDSLAISSEIVLIPVHVHALDGSSSFAFNTTYGRYQINIYRVSEENQPAAIRRMFPNPFIIGQHQNQRFLFAPVIPIELEVRILDFNGRVVRSVSLNESEGTLRPSGFDWDGSDNGSYLWDGRDDNGNYVASGVYILRLKQGKNTDFVKFAVVNK